MSSPTTHHVRPLDGMRGIAVLMVVLVHLSGNYTWGALGVNVFFALSGFLITGILLRELDQTGGLRKARFYTRRALRLYPALIGAVVVSFVLWLEAGTPGDSHAIGVSALAALTYTSNLVIEVTGRELGPLNHTWTLAVEEQFYLLWPLLLLWGAFRRNLLRILPVVIVALIAIRATFADQRIETLLPVHADQLMLGALLAAALLDPGVRLRLERVARPVIVPLLAGAAFIALIVAVPMEATPGAEYPFFMAGGYTVAAAVAVVLIAHVLAAPTSLVSRLLSLAPIVVVGRVSYGVYLYHFPIVRWAERHEWFDGTGYKIAALALTALVVAFSWFFIERPALRYKDRLDERRATKAADDAARAEQAQAARARQATKQMDADPPNVRV